MSDIIYKTVMSMNFIIQIGIVYIGVAVVIVAISTVDEVKSCELNIGLGLATALLWLPLALIVLTDMAKEVINK